MSSYSPEQINLINKTTTEFYKAVADSFSETRNSEWEGWNNLLKFFHDGDSVLDLGCGNKRFSKFLAENNINVNVDNIDNYAWDSQVRQMDIIDSLLNNNLNLKSYDVAVCFGLMHHIPSAKLRLKLLEELCKSKFAIVSFWQFYKNERLFGKAKSATKLAEDKLGIKNLEDGDCFLCWKDREDVFRFCHNFDDDEILSLKNKFNVYEDFCADGNPALNRYLIIKH